MQFDNLLTAGMESSPQAEAVEPTTKIEFGKDLNDLRQRVVRGEEVTREELRAAIVTLRETFGIKVTAAKKETRKAAPKKKAGKVSAEDAQKMLDSLNIPGL